MRCNGFHIAEVIRECVRQMEPVEEQKLIAAVNDSLDPLFRLPPSHEKRRTSRISYIKQYIRHLFKAGLISKRADLYVSSASSHKSIVNGSCAKVRQMLKVNGKCTHREVRAALGESAANMLHRLKDQGQATLTDGYYELTASGMLLTPDIVDRTRRLCGFKPNLV